jgi:hypothetical protein
MLGKFNIILTNLALYTQISLFLFFFVFFSSLDFSFFYLIFSCFGVITVILAFVLFSLRAGKILDAAAKIGAIVAGISVTYTNHGGGSGSTGDASDKNTEKETKNDNKDETDTKKTNDSKSDGNTTTK